jgi:hypothetical protein
MSYMSKFVAASISLLIISVFAGRQLFLFTVFRSPQGFLNSPAGRYHLWLALSAGISACIAGGLMFHFFLRHERSKWSKEPRVPVRTLINAISDTPSSKLVTPAPFDARRWAERNPWLSEGQPDDRRPMNGAVGVSTGSSSERRATARRTHQLMYKAWSQARHD